MVKQPTLRVLLPLLLAVGRLISAQEIDLQGLASKLAQAIAKSGKKVAVVDFVDLHGNPTELGRFFAEEISVALVGSVNSNQVVDRLHVKTIIAEHKLAEKGLLIDPAIARQAAQFAGAGLLLTGTVTPLSGTVRVSAKVLDVETAQIVAAAGIDVPRTKGVDEMLSIPIGAGESAQSTVASDRVDTSISGQTGRRFGAARGGDVSVTVKDFTFDITSCRVERGNLQCTLRVRNLGEDAVLVVGLHGCGGAPTRIIDDRGNEYIVKSFQLGTKVDDGGRCLIDNELASKVTMAAVMRFENIAPSANTIALLEIPFSRQGERGGAKAQFHDIPIQH